MASALPSRYDINQDLAHSQLPGSRPSLRILEIAAILVLAQAALGVSFRHGIIDVTLHVVGALVVLIFIVASMGSADIDPSAVIVVTIVHAATAALTLAATVVTMLLVLRSVPANVNR